MIDIALGIHTVAASVIIVALPIVVVLIIIVITIAVYMAHCVICNCFYFCCVERVY